MVNEERLSIIKKLKSIPHLRLNKKFDLEKIICEYESISYDDFYPYDSRAITPQVRDTIISSWWGCSLMSSDGLNDGDLTEGHKPTNVIPTPASTKCGYILKCLSEIGDVEKSIVRIMKIKPGGQLSWHSHAYDYGIGNNSTITIHVPIIVPEKFKYSVISIRDNRLIDYEIERPKVYSKRYDPGEAWIFNSYHMHNVFNHDTYDRVSIMMYASLENEKTFKLVSDAINSYTGETISDEYT